jgi:hypothetical protein
LPEDIEQDEGEAGEQHVSASLDGLGDEAGPFLFELLSCRWVRERVWRNSVILPYGIL